MSPLPDDLDALSSRPPEVADWPGLVRGTVRARARRRAAVSVAAALSLVVASSAGVVWARDGERDSTLVASSPSPSPSAIVLEPSEPCDTPPAPMPDVAPPADDGDDVLDVRLQVLVSCLTVRVGEPLVVVATAAGDLFAPTVSAVIDGVYRGPIADCAAPSTAAPRPTPSPGIQTERFEHTYDAPGTDDVVVTGAPLCGDTSGQATATFRITVLPARGDVEPTATPTLSTAPTADPAPSGSPTPSPSPEAAYPPARNVVSIDVTFSPARPKVGEEVTITVVARGDKGGVRFKSISFDRGRQGIQGPDYSCPQAEPEPPRPSEAREVFTHVYEEPGDDGVYIAVDSGCGYYQGSGQKTVFVTVDPAEGASASPSPTPLPS